MTRIDRLRALRDNPKSWPIVRDHASLQLDIEDRTMPDANGDRYPASHARALAAQDTRDRHRTIDADRETPTGMLCFLGGCVFVGLVWWWLGVQIARAL